MSNRDKTTYISDPKLVPRIKLFLKNKSAESIIHPESVVQHLQATYSDCTRKKKNAFLHSVSKALSVAQLEMFGSEADSTGVKRQKQDSSSDSEPEGLVAYKNTNLMNLAMRNVYKNTRASKDPNSPSSPEQPQKSKKKKLHQTPALKSWKETESPSASPRWVVDRSGSNEVIGEKMDSGDYQFSGPDSVIQKNGASLADSVVQGVGGTVCRCKCTCGARNTVNNTATVMSSGRVGLETPVRPKKGNDGDKGTGFHAAGVQGKGVAETGEDKPDDSTRKKKGKRNKRLAQKEITEEEPTVPAQTLEDFGGSEKLKEELEMDLEELNDFEYCRFSGLHTTHSYLLHGPQGSGKKFLVECIAGHMKMPLLNQRTTTLVSGVSGDSEQRIRDLFEEAASLAPCVLYLEDIDVLAPRGAAKDMTSRIVTELCSCIDALKTQQENVLLFAATSKLDSVHESLRIPGRFIEKTLSVPDENARESILRKMSCNMLISPDYELRTLARLTPGFVGGDLLKLVQEALSRGLRRVRDLYRTPGMRRYVPPAHLSGQGTEIAPTEQDKQAQTLTEQDFIAALEMAQPAALREGFATVPTTTWEDIGALQPVRDQLEDSILLCIREQKTAGIYEIPTNFGVMLVGPPGCGKTLVAKAMANEAGLNFMHIRGPELLDKYVGESERKVRSKFEKAQMCAPCLIFFDEMDALCSNRQSDGGGNVSKSVTNQLLALMDGCGERKQVYVMGATNMIESIDPAMLRPGRFDKKIFIGLPDTAGRLDILKALTKDSDTRKFVSCDLQYLAEETEGCSGADLKKLRDEAALLACKEHIKLMKDEGDAFVTNEHFRRALPQVKPSVMKKAAEKYLEAALQCDPT